VIVTNELAGSGGDALPWFFRREKIGPIVGTRTYEVKQRPDLVVKALKNYKGIPPRSKYLVAKP
jgi:hypothetical protein